MADLARLVVEVDSSGVVTAVKNLDELKTRAGHAETATKSFKDKWESTNKTLSTAFFGLELLKQGFQGIVGAVGPMIEAYTEAEQASIKLDAVYRATGGTVGVTTDALRQLANELSRHSLVDDDAIVNAEALMLTFKSVRQDGFEPALKAALDLSATFGMDLNSATVMLGKALEDPVSGLTALRRIGVSFTDSQEEVIKAMNATNDSAGAQAEILKVVNGQVSGVADNMANSATGAVIKLGQAWGNLQESFGKNFVEVLAPMFDWLTGKLDEASGKVMTLAGARGAIAGSGIGYEGHSTGELQGLLAASIADLAKHNKTLATMGTVGGPDLYAETAKRLIESLYIQIQLREIAAKKVADKNSAIGAVNGYAYLNSSNPYGDAENDRFGQGSIVDRMAGGAPSWVVELMKKRLGKTDESPGTAQNATDFMPKSTFDETEWENRFRAIRESQDATTQFNTAVKDLEASFARLVAQDAVSLFTSLGEAMASGTDASGALGDMAMKMLDQLPMLLLQAGLNAMLTGPASPTFWMGVAMITASGAIAFLDGAAHGATTKATTATQGTTSATKTVNDAIITKDGQVINTHPDDNLYAFKALPGGGKGGGSNVVVHNYSGAQVQTQEKTGANGQRELVIMVGQLVNQHIADGRADRVAGARWGVGFGGRSAS